MTSKEKLVMSLLSNKKDINKDTSYIKDIYRPPKKDIGVEAPQFPSDLADDLWQQADLLFLPNDKGFMYCLVVVDVGSRLVDAEQLKDKKSSTVLSALIKIYKRKYLDPPKVLTVDAGTEFKSDFARELQKIKITLNVAKKGRHRQVALVERKNQSIGKIIHQIITHDELETGHSSSEWVSYLPSIIKAININTSSRKEKKVEFNQDPIYTTKDLELLNVGDRVRIPLEEPRDLTTKKKLVGKFRSGDIRWDLKETVVSKILMKPMTPILYIVESEPGVGYTRNQLQLVKHSFKKQENTTDYVENRFTVKKLLDRKIINGLVKFLVHWEGFKKSESTWERRTNLIHDIPQMIKAFELKQLQHERKYGKP